jgi:hypothetical protein
VTIPELPGAEPRLQRRYHQLVVSHLSSAQRVAAGLRAPAAGDAADPFAATQAAWRFYANPNVGLPELAAPLVACARAAIRAACDRFALVVLDWSPLHFGGHGSKPDRVPLAHARDLGYDLLTALAVSGRDGAPLAPLALELRAADGVHATRAEHVLEPPSRLDGLTPLIEHVESLDLGRPTVYVIDRAADSVGHLRAWHADGRRFVVRADDAPRVLYRGVRRPLGEVADALRRSPAGAFADAGDVEFKGRPARQFVAEAAVTLDRPARTHRVDPATGEAKHRNVAGEPLRLRLVAGEVRDPASSGEVLARWLLLTNVPPGGADAATVARWYYWRWRVASYHKLLKGAGQQVEQWQQESAAALARRLLVAAMACVVVWRLARDERPEAATMRDVLVRLSGRQMRRGKGARGFTEPALLAGLGVLLPMLDLLERHDAAELRAMADAALPGLLRRRDGG